jgi:hypothetical protein
MMLLGIVLHAATFYLAAPPPHVPIVTDPNKSLVMDGIFELIHAFRMPCFFVLAGFFTALLVEKRGVAGAYRNRLARIGGPLLAGMFTLLPVTLLFMVAFSMSVHFGSMTSCQTARTSRSYGKCPRRVGMPEGIPVMHLWFLLYPPLLLSAADPVLPDAGAVEPCPSSRRWAASSRHRCRCRSSRFSPPPRSGPIPAARCLATSSCWG